LTITGKRTSARWKWKLIVAPALLGMLWGAAPARAQQQYSPPQARRQFVTFSYDWLYIYPLHFAEHPLEDLVGADVDPTDPPYDYRTEDGRTFIDVLEFKRRAQGIGVTLYPLGMSVGPTLGIRGSIERLPDIRIRFDGPGSLDSYSFTGGIAYDIGAGLWVADRAPGWGLGSYAFVLGGIGRITSDDLDGGSRYFAEGGGGVQSGPIGFELSVKFGWNRLSDPVEHRFLTVPINMRATVSF
jgi:hypothetical protein